MEKEEDAEMLSIQNINVIFNKNTDTEKKVLFDLSLIIEKGEFVTIVRSVQVFMR